LPHHVGRTNEPNEWAESPLAVSGVLCDPDDEEAMAFSMSHTISVVGFERPL
jgi:hypothetical protein